MDRVKLKKKGMTHRMIPIPFINTIQKMRLQTSASFSSQLTVIGLRGESSRDSLRGTDESSMIAAKTCAARLP